MPPRLFKKLRLLLLRRLLLRLTLPDSRESMSSQEERLRPNSKCLKLSNRWRPSKPSNSRNRDSWRTKPTLRSKNKWQRSNKLKLMYRLSRMLPLKLRKKPPRRKLLRRRDLLSKKPLRRRPRSSNKRRKPKKRRKLRRQDSLRKRRRRLSKSDSCNSKNKRLRNNRDNKNWHN